ncbi:MAG TPA: lipoate--protein ligase [Candidatus Megamonas gallistercoris]|nr:lipoate--protein ligase [Candidatus Megamonas gallistercoris]
MINKIKIYDNASLNPYHNLAVEEYLMMHTGDSELIVYLWQNEHTIVIGRNQNVWQECKVSEFTKDGGRIVRRLSGGGAVYHDLGNLNFTFCVKKADYDVDKQLEVILTAVQLLGINARKTGRNDITIEGRKFSGNAFYRTGQYCYHHGTLLLDADTEKMVQYLNVDTAKLQSKGVSSVKARVTNLKNYCADINRRLITEKIKTALKNVYECDIGIIKDTDLNENEIIRLENKFSDWNWIFGRKIPFTNQISRRFVWGNMDIHIVVDEGRIRDIEIYSDMLEQDFIPKMKDILKNCRYDKNIIAEKMIMMQEGYLSQQQMQDIIELIKEKL